MGAGTRAGVCLAVAFWLISIAPGVLAHGDTIKVTYGSVKPARLVIEAGTEVHFHNGNASGAVCTIVLQRKGAANAKGEAVATSPALGRAGGWHYTFEEPGEYTFFLKEYTSRTGEVKVVPKRAP